MKYVISELKDITDSKELLESTTPKFTSIFIYIILTLFVVVISWSVLCEKEVVTKCNGIVEPNNEVINISNLITSKVNSINFNEGDTIKEGQVLYTLENNDLENQKTAYEKKVNSYSKDIENLKKLKTSISDGKDYFSTNEEDKPYKEKFAAYLSNITNKNSSALQDLNSSISNLTLLKKSVEEGKCYLNKDSSYYYKYTDYSLNLDTLTKSLESNKSKLSELIKSNAPNDQTSEINANIASINSNITKLKNSTILSVVSDIEQVNQKLKELSTPVDDDKYKHTALSEIDDSLKLAQNNLDDANLNLTNIKSQLDQTTIKATKDGTISFINPIHKGDVLQPGQQVASILPKSSDKFKLIIYIQNKDIATIKAGQSIQCSFISLPQSEYGTIKSNVDKISNNATVDQRTGSNYYTAEATIDNKKLIGYKKDSAELKNGMACQVNIVTRRVSYFHYFLEQLNFVKSN